MTKRKKRNTTAKRPSGCMAHGWRNHFRHGFSLLVIKGLLRCHLVFLLLCWLFALDIFKCLVTMATVWGRHGPSRCPRPFLIRVKSHVNTVLTTHTTTTPALVSLAIHLYTVKFNLAAKMNSPRWRRPLEIIFCPASIVLSPWIWRRYVYGRLYIYWQQEFEKSEYKVSHLLSSPWSRSGI